LLAIVSGGVGSDLMGLRLAGRSGRARVRDGGHAHIRGLAQDLCSSHVRRLHSGAAAGGRLLRRLIAELLCASRVARAASPAATQYQGEGV
jgi:hypothetical protein